MNVAILGGLAGKRSTWLSGYSYRKSFTYSRASGAVSDYQVKILVKQTAGLLGDELLTNPSFDANNASWTAFGGSIANVSGGQSGNCLQATYSSAISSNGAYSEALATTVGKRYRLSAYVKSGTSGNEACAIGLADAPGYGNAVTVASTSSGTWTQLSGDVTALASSQHLHVIKSTNTAGTMLFDEASIKEILANVSCEGHCEADFDDLRFTKSDGITELDYWIESVSDSVATVWVELDSVGTDATTFYMYYGNADASAGSSGADTFLLFDDFDNETFDTTTNWTTTMGTPTETGTILTTQGAGTTGGFCSQSTWGTGYAVRTRANFDSTADYSMIGFNGMEGYWEPSVMWMTYQDQYYVSIDGSHKTTSAKAISFDEYHIFDFERIDSNKVILSIDGIETTIETNIPTGNLAVGARGDTNANHIWIDWMLVRKCLETEPALGSWGSEEAA